ncbi:MAG: carboxypeptidase M32, partial [Alphaproteobacteria bacterium]|nr:carboxypeptidase M32 [Alphaproteobacteria bacterium]
MTISNSQSAYESLQERFRRIAALGDALAVLSWDRQTIMPSGGGDARAEQMATLQVLRHEAITAGDMADLLDATATGGLDAWQAANLREMKRAHAHATALTGELVDATARASAACETAWLEARPANDFAGIIKPLENLLALTREG